MLKAALLRFLFAGIILIPGGGLRATTSPRIQAPLTVTHLRVGGLENPLGFDEPQPRLSWQLRSGTRGTRQTGYRVLVASTAELLAQDRGDLWDTGRVESDENVRLVYAGTPLRSAQIAFWKVRIWDEKNQPSAWSAAASWTGGIMSPDDWSSATRWISDPELLRWQRTKLGYRSQATTDVATRKWLQFDLGASVPIDSVRLFAIKHTVDENLGFPVRYQLEVADRADFSDARLVVPVAATDFNPWLSVIDLPLKDVIARYVRFTATKLRVFHGEACLAISQIEVISAGKNLASSAAVSAGDSVEDAQWSLAAVNDGLGVPGVNPRASDSLRLRRGFAVKAGLKRALLSVSGLGHYTLAVNGAQVDAGLLTPGWTDYRKTCLYDTHDLTAKLREGPNALGLTLAGGMYNVQSGFKRYVKFISAYRPLKAFGELRLEYIDGTTETIGTDARWRVSPGAETYSNVFGGEDHDARRAVDDWSGAEFDDSSWTPAAPTNGPGGVLRGAAWSSPRLVAHESLAPVAVKEISPGVRVYDFGQNTAMMPRLRVRGFATSRVRLIPGELLRSNGTVDRGSSGGGAAYWQYTLNGNIAGETWLPSFFYHGARYLQVELIAREGRDTLPVIEKLESVVVHSDSSPAGTFACANDLFNRIHSLVRWAQRSNLMSVLSDCPHRERLGWLEQYHLNGPALRYEWDLRHLFAKAFNDMTDAQHADGRVPSIAPEYVRFDGAFGDSPEWGSALILAAWQHYIFTGDGEPLRRHYGAMQRYVDYLASRADGHIVSHGLGDWYDVGPKPPGVAQLTPIPLTATAIYYEDMRAMARIANVLAKPSDAIRYEKQAAEIAAAFNRKFFNAETGAYATGSQTAQAMPLVLGIVAPENRPRVVDALVRDIADRNNSVTAGDVGYRYLLRALADAGRSDVIYAMNNQSEKPGYGLQLARGATSLTEAWDANPRNSQNHFMLGQINEWFYQDLAGLGVDPAAPGFKNVLIRPQPVGDLAWAEASHRSPYGEIKVRWDRPGKEFRLKTTVPPNSTATVWLPVRDGKTVRESGTPVERASSVRFLRHEGSESVYAIESGTYVFETTL